MVWHRLSEVVAKHFLGERVVNLDLDDLSPWRATVEPELLLRRASEWLNDALRRGEDSDGKVAAHLAEIVIERSNQKQLFASYRVFKEKRSELIPPNQDSPGRLPTGPFT